MKRIFLSGFMGSGKTTVGKLLSRELGSSFHDLDDLICQAARMSIPDIFRSGGEEQFRNMEAALLNEFIEMEGVLVLGGGSLLNPHSREKVLSAGVLVYLRTGLNTLVERLNRSGTGRPLLDSEETIEECMGRILQERKGVYDQAHIIVDTDGRTPEAVAGVILDKVKETGNWKLN
ncbi:MAG: shikimate kinase [bacterium]